MMVTARSTPIPDQLQQPACGCVVTIEADPWRPVASVTYCETHEDHPEVPTLYQWVRELKARIAELEAGR